MIIARAPVRISLAGGGTDLEAYYGRYGGTVISTSIDKYFYVFLNADGRDNIQISSSDYRTFYRAAPGEPSPWESDLTMPRAILDHFGIRRGVSVFLASEVPPGTGLGSSSTVTVAICKAVAELRGQSPTRAETAEVACVIEIGKMGMPIGKQDQYAAACGGLNQLIFSNEGVEVNPLRLSMETLLTLEENLLLFYTGTAHDSSVLLSIQQQASQQEDGGAIRALHSVKAMVGQVKDCLERGQLRRFAQLLDANWQQKKRFGPGVTTPHIDECYELALRNGGLGGKVTGAGGGGFLMIYCEADDQARVTQALQGKGMRRMDFKFEYGGAQILVSTGLKMRDV